MSILQRIGVVPKIIILGLLLAGAYFTADRWLPMRRIVAAVVPKQAMLMDKDVGDNAAKDVAVVLPSGRPVTRNLSKQVRLQVMQWNAQLGLFLANGGPATLTDSTIGKRGAQVAISNENDTDKMKENVYAFARAWAANGGRGNVEQGTTGVIVMGDGAPAYISSWNDQLRKICQEAKLQPRRCEVAIVGSVGSSYGEDQVFVPVEWKDNPQQALGKNTKHGGLIAAYFWDGDHALALYWAAINGLKVNPDERTWDAEAVNFLNPKDFLDAVEKYNQGFCEDRSEVSGGKPTGRKVNVCVEGVATWTPGDTNIAKGSRDTLVSAISTRENRNQMSASLLVIRGWAEDNADTLAAVFAGTSEASDMIKSSDQALRRASEYAVAIYGKGGLSANEWANLYKGVQHRTKNGYDVRYGGSRVWNLADNLDYYGLGNGASVYAAVYQEYGGMIAQLAPSVIKHLEPVESVTYLAGLQKAQELLGGKIGTADKVTFAPGNVQEVVGAANYTINFDTGSDRVRSESSATVNQIYRRIVAGSLKVEVIGHTDNVGNPDFNRQLSERRANSVVREIVRLGRGGQLPPERFSVRGRGQDQPVDPAANQNDPRIRARNRRVEIILGH